MKKITFITFIIFVVLCTFTGTFAQKPDSQIPQVSPYIFIDDIQVNEEYTIDDLGIVKVGGVEQWDEYWNSVGYRKADYDGILQADTIVLMLDITNITFTPKNFLEKVNVKMVYNDQYEINGWWHQLKEEYEYVYDFWTYEEKQVYKYVSQSNIMEIEPFYQGYYRFGVTVPDYIINDNKPLYLEVFLNGVTLTYYIR